MYSSLSTGSLLTDNVIGMAVVFAALIVLSVLGTALVRLFGKKETPAAPVMHTEPATQPIASSAYNASTNAAAGELRLSDVDDRTAAILMAIVADQSKTPLNRLYFTSIICLNP